VDDGVCLVLPIPMVVSEGDDHVGCVHSAEVVWDKLRGESLCERVGTLGGDGRSVLGVTTVGGNGAFCCGKRK
jgi:hypothetical protein